MRSAANTVAGIRTSARNKAALLLFGRTVVITLSIVSAALGFMAGIRIQSANGNYEPYAFATGVGALFAAACAVIAFLLMRRRIVAERLRTLEVRFEELSDRNWELREAEERARSLLEAQGDLLLDTPLTPEQVTYAKAAKTSGETLLALIEEILDFSKIEAGKLDLEARVFTLSALVEEAVELLAPRAQAKGIEIASFVDERLPRQ